MIRFETIHLETIHGCSRACWFCPNSHIRGTGALMPWEMIEGLLAQLVAMGFDGTVRPYLMNEAFLDQRMMEIVRTIRERLPNARCVINSNGDLLTPEMALALVALGVKIRVSAYDRATIEKFRGAPVHVTNFVRSKTELAQIFNNRSGNIEMPGAEPRQGTCVLPWTSLPVRHNGDVVLCCNDYNSDVVMGNVNEASLAKIWQNRRFTAYRKALGTCDRSSLRLCSQCSFLGV